MKRSIRLPESVDEEAVKATYQNGSHGHVAEGGTD